MMVLASAVDTDNGDEAVRRFPVYSPGLIDNPGSRHLEHADGIRLDLFDLPLLNSVERLRLTRTPHGVSCVVRHYRVTGN
ncbi:unnamed protein product [Macrosiphum euphorbiae]|uniref:Uncharacterized protein n=1 Tax=Macrosiphum euphorbiae TaxID=13131 RepID=A0AAV0WUG2_9HEMI|nr:unnamed protein product [Macrosiphum euphorbiae]